MPDQGLRTPAQAARRLDPAGLSGAWVNTEDSPRGVARVVIERRHDALGVWALGADEHTHEGWGWTDAEAVYAASDSGDAAVAFTAAFRAPSMPIAVHANVSKGLLIVSSFQMSTDSENPDARFAREFFRRDDSESPRLPRNPSVARPVSHTTPVSTFAGVWRNTNSEGPAIDSVSFAATEAGPTMRILGRDESGPRDWGTTDVEVYTEVGTTTDPAKIKARYGLGAMEVLLHGWVKQGVLVLALFRRFQGEDGRSNYFDREFFYRTG